MTFILYLLWSDVKESDGSSHALWIPLVWMFLAGSRFVSHWLNLDPATNVLEVYRDGSPADRAVFTALIVAGGAVLYRRGLDWGEVLVQNKWICLFFLYCAMSVIWSDDPLITLRRFIKLLGTPIMALLILTEKRPYEAMCTILRRLAFVLLPLSILLIKYYPDMGRAYHMGRPMFIGVATQKNILGQTCLISGIYFFWALLFNRYEQIRMAGFPHVVTKLLFLGMVAWLLYKADSATSITCFLVAIGFLSASRLPILAYNYRRFVFCVATIVMLLGVLEYTLGMSDAIIAALGRRSDLTSRVPMWEMLLSWDINPLIGVGFESFWSGDRLVSIWRRWPGIIQAHNGYIDLYLNLGIMGLLLLCGCILGGLAAAVKQIDYDYPVAVLRLGIVITFLLYNWTEATVASVSSFFLLLLLVILDMSTEDAAGEIGEDPDSHEDRTEDITMTS